jgi:hypothetical protein
MMPSFPSRITRQLFRSEQLHAAFWIAMLAVHLPGLFSGWRAVFSAEFAHIKLAGFVALNLSALLFVLKWRGVRWLEFDTSPRALLSLTLAVFLIHSGVVSDSENPALNASPQLVASLMFVTSLTQVRRIVQRQLRPGGKRRRGEISSYQILLDTPRVVARCFAPALAPRAPPAV